MFNDDSNDDLKKECLQSTRLYQLSEARNAFDSKDYFKAHRLFEECLTGSHESIAALLLACAAALYCSAFKRSLDRANEILKRNPQDIQALTLKAIALNSLQQFADAKRHISRALHLNPESPTIQKYAKIIGQQESAISSKERRWKRAPLQCSLLISDTLTGIVAHFKTLSLSAGGCLIEGDHVPNEFSFDLELSPHYRITGCGERRYRTSSQQLGIAFRNLEITKTDAINQAVLKKRSSA